MNDDARSKIFERRAAFVAAAIASVATASCERTDPCLSSVSTETRKSPADASVTTADTEVGPSVCLSESVIPCLSPPMPTADAARPHACLSKPRPAKPEPCLEFVE